MYNKVILRVCILICLVIPLGIASVAVLADTNSAQSTWLQGLFQSASYRRSRPVNLFRGLSYSGGGAGGMYGTSSNCGSSHGETSNEKFYGVDERYDSHYASGETTEINLADYHTLQVFTAYAAICSTGTSAPDQAYATSPNGEKIDAVTVYFNGDSFSYNTPLDDVTQMMIVLPLEAYALPGLWHLTVIDGENTFELGINILPVSSPFILVQEFEHNDRVLIGGFVPNERVIGLRGVMLSLNDSYNGDYEFTVNAGGYAIVEGEGNIDPTSEYVYAFISESGRSVYVGPINIYPYIAPNLGLPDDCGFGPSEFGNALYEFYWKLNDNAFKLARFNLQSAVDVHQGPGYEYPIVGQLQSGDNPTLSGTNQDRTWVRLFQSENEWIPADAESLTCGSLENLANVVNDNTTIHTYRVIGVADNDVLNVRIGPGVGNSIVGTLAPTAQGIEITGQGQTVGQSLWVPIRYNDLVGWVNSRYLAEQ